MLGLNAWQMVLWIVGLEILSAPIIASTFNVIFTGYFKAKGQYIGLIAKASSDALGKTLDGLQKGKSDGEKSD